MVTAFRFTLSDVVEKLMFSEKQKMLAGEFYLASDAELEAERHAASLWMGRFNASQDLSSTESRALLCERVCQVGEGAIVRPP